MLKVRIKLNSIDIEMLNNICESIKEMSKKSGVMTVPVIDIDGEFTGESDIIVQKLEGLKK